MATVLDVIKAAMRKIKVLRAGETPSSEDADDVMAALNTMLEAWASEVGPVYSFTTNQKALTAGDGQYTMGSGGDIDTTWPDAIDVDGSFIRDSDGNDWPLLPLTEREYNAISDKSPGNDIPTHLFWKPSYPLGTIYLYPPPQSSLTLHLLSSQKWAAFSDVNGSFAFPPGYQRAIEDNLAVEIAPDFGKEPSPLLAARANRGKDHLFNKNYAERLTPKDLGLPAGNTGGNAYLLFR